MSIETYYESGAIARISGNPGSIEMTIDPNFDLSMRDISIVARIDQPQRTNLRMRLTDTDGETLSLVSEYHRDLHPTGWLTFTLSVAEAEADLSSIENILISLDGGDKAPLYWLDDLRFPQRTSNTAQFSFTFDDNTRDVYETFYPIMREFGSSGSDAIITDQIGESGRLTLTKIDELAEAGWSIDNHTHGLSTLHGLSKADQRDTIGTANEILRDQGFDPKSIMYPGGQCDRATLEVAAENNQYGFLAFTSPYKGIAPSVTL
ncbi:polysaccharide deacetylase family protein [Halalkalicoccus paucihalophilus]|nr:polysaccharide deacetylase family protein [Halalkalicoccus paucihalophilus]